MKRLQERILPLSIILAFLSILIIFFVSVGNAPRFSSNLFVIAISATCLLIGSILVIGLDLFARRTHQEQLSQLNKELEKKILVQTTELGSVMERITDAFLALDKNWCLTYINSKAAEVIHRDPEMVIGKNIWDEFSSDHSHPFYIATHKAMEEQVYTLIDVYYEPYQRWYENHMYPSPEGLSIFFRDITDKKIAEKNIRDSEEKRRLIMNAALDAIICIDTGGHITFWNPQAEKIFGWKDSEVNGQPLSGIIIPERYREMHNKGMAAYLQTGRGPALNVLLELSAVNRDGNEFPVELTVLAIKQGNEEFFCAFIRDITKRKKDLDVIRRNNERYDIVLKATHDSIWDWDMVTNEVVRGEKKLETLYGHTPPWEPHEVDEQWNKHAHAGDWARVTQTRNQIFNDPLQNYWEDEYRFLRTDGEYGYVSDRGYIIRDANGKAIRMIGASNDISERKKAEEALTNSELRFRSLIEKGSEIIAMHDREGKIIYISPSVKSQLGYDPEERKGKPTFEFVHPDDLPFVKNKLAILMSIPGAVDTAQWRHRHADGSWHWMEGITTNLLHDPSVNAVVHNFRDITDRKKVENELIESNERFEYATKATFDAVWDSDLVTNITYWGNGFEVIFGHKLNNTHLNNDSWTDLIHPDDKERVLENISRLINSNGTNWSAEYRFLKANGQYAFVRDKGVVVRNENGTAIRMIGAMQDITLAKQEEQQLKNAEEELRQKNEELKKLSVYLKDVREEERKYIAREVHDELGQLASALKIDVDWLKIKYTGVDDIGKMRMTHATKTIEVLISSIRKIASSLRPSVLDDFGLNAAIEWQCREFQNLNSIQCIFDADFDDQDLPMEIKTELFRMTQESLTNVMRHSGATHVTVQLKEDEEMIYLKITDDGKGFDTSVKKNTLGLIGLRERAVSVNGLLRIESEPGKGTIVSAVIPKR